MIKTSVKYFLSLLAVLWLSLAPLSASPAALENQLHGISEAITTQPGQTYFAPGTLPTPDKDWVAEVVESEEEEELHSSRKKNEGGSKFSIGQFTHHNPIARYAQHQSFALAGTLFSTYTQKHYIRFQVFRL